MKTLLLLLGVLSILAATTFQERMNNKILEGSPQFQKDVTDCFDGSAKACLDAGKYYSAEGYKENKDPKEVSANVAAFYKRACDLGRAEGCTAYAMIFAADTQKDPKKDAQYYFQKGCDGGHTPGCTLLKMLKER